MTAKWNLYAPQCEGEFARQAHVGLPAGTFEREVGREGFAGAATHFYHRNPPTSWVSATGPVRPRAFAPLAPPVVRASPWDATPLFANASVGIRMVTLAGTMDHLARNADGDELLFVHEGAAEFFCDYGHLAIEPGDYVVIPRGTMWRIETAAPLTLLMIEATGRSYALPERGLIGRHAPFDPGVFDRPQLDRAFKAQPQRGEWALRVKRGDAIGTLTYPYNPLDAIGWKGDLYPVRLNMRDIRSITSEGLHLPPSLRTTFVSERFVVCSLVPRLMETDPAAIKLPFFHNNDDYDEVIFQHRGKHNSRAASIKAGTLTFHPCGTTHGPHPEMLPHMFEFPTAKTESYSVMIDTRDPLHVVAPPAANEIADYAESWRGSLAYAPDAQPAPAATA
jgi:homogentisate 1,2-dioxygenase